MNPSHQFGGNWTEEKLDRVRKYLDAYMTIFTKNVKASWYKTVYVDAFAGTDYRAAGPKNEDMSVPLFVDREAASFQKGSAYTALETEPSFDTTILYLSSIPEMFPSSCSVLLLPIPGVLQPP
jgi:three-Cys-motif partner protein